MNDLVLEELISAYVDGELSSDEQVLVERALSQSARCRQLHSEFLALRSSLETLPREDLDPEFNRRVMQQIAKLTGKEVPLGARAVNGSPAVLPAVASEAQAAEPQIVVVSDRDEVPGKLRRRAMRPLVWIAGVAAAILLAFGLSRGYFGVFPKSPGENEIVENPGGSSTGSDVIPGPEQVLPVGPREAVANDGNPTRDPGPEEVPDPQPRNIDATGAPVPEVTPGSLAHDANPREVPVNAPMPPEEDASPAPNDPPLVARNDPPESPNGASSSEPSTENATLLAFDYGSPDFHVIRLFARPEALRNGALDEILRGAGIAFAATNAGNANAAARPAPEFDFLLVHAVPKQIDAALLAIGKRGADFRPLAPYTVSQDRFLQWITADTVAAMNNPTEASQGGNALGQYLELSSDSTQKTYVWRAAPSSRKLVDQSFPIPARPAIAQAPRRGAEDVDADRSVDVIFIVVLEQ